MVYYDPLDREYKSVIGAIKQNEKIKFRVKGDFDSVFFVFRKDGESGETAIKTVLNGGFFETEVLF